MAKKLSDVISKNQGWLWIGGMFLLIGLGYV